MKFNTHQFALSAALTIGLAYLICALAVWLWPDTVLQLMETLFHVANLKTNLGDLHLTLGGFFGGLVQAVLYPYLAIYGFGSLYNFLASHRLPMSSQA